MRIFLPLSIVASLGLASPIASVGEPSSAGEFLLQCKTAPESCEARIAQEARRLNATGEACVATSVTDNAKAEKLLHTLEEVLEESPGDFENADSTMIIRQLIVLLWPCENRPIA